jgi:hypothetical protein
VQHSWDWLRARDGPVGAVAIGADGTVTTTMRVPTGTSSGALLTSARQAKERRIGPRQVTSDQNRGASAGE